MSTLWPDYWDTLTRNPAHRDPATRDEHAQARQLLERTGIVVPASFDQEAVDALLAGVGTDPRLVEAATHGSDGELAQYLAGAPALVKRYQEAPTAPRALLMLAMDLRRLGHGPAIPRDLLEAGVSAYLSQREWGGLNGDWFAAALHYAQEPCHGAHQPLTQIRPRPGQPEFAQPHYRLADYLEQIGQHRRSHIIPPPLWDILRDHIRNPDDAGRIGQAAANRMLYRCALPLLDYAVNTGYRDAADRLVKLLNDRGDEAGLRALADIGN